MKSRAECSWNAECQHHRLGALRHALVYNAGLRRASITQPKMGSAGLVPWGQGLKLSASLPLDAPTKATSGYYLEGASTLIKVTLNGRVRALRVLFLIKGVPDQAIFTLAFSLIKETHNGRIGNQKRHYLGGTCSLIKVPSYQSR